MKIHAPQASVLRNCREQPPSRHIPVLSLACSVPRKTDVYRSYYPGTLVFWFLASFAQWERQQRIRQLQGRQVWVLTLTIH